MEPAKDATQDDSRFAAAMMVSPLRTRRVPLAIVMCGRFTNRLTWEELVRLYRLTLDQPAQNTRARYNVCPTDPIPTIVERDGKRECVSMRWALVPYWWSKPLRRGKGNMLGFLVGERSSPGGLRHAVRSREVLAIFA